MSYVNIKIEIDGRDVAFGEGGWFCDVDVQVKWSSVEEDCVPPSTNGEEDQCVEAEPRHRVVVRRDLCPAADL